MLDLFIRVLAAGVVACVSFAVSLLAKNDLVASVLAGLQRMITLVRNVLAATVLSV